VDYYYLAILIFSILKQVSIKLEDFIHKFPYPINHHDWIHSFLLFYWLLLSWAPIISSVFVLRGYFSLPLSYLIQDFLIFLTLWLFLVETFFLIPILN